MLFVHPIHFRLFYKPGKDLSRLFVSSVFRQSSISLTAFFSSIYIYTLLVQQGFVGKSVLVVIILFYCTVYITKSITLFAAEKFTLIKGFKASIQVSLIPFFLSIGSYALSEYNFVFIFLAAIFWGVHAGFYWWGYHGYFIKSSKVGSYGKSIGEMDFFRTIAAILTPIIGSFIVKGFGFNYMFLLAAFTMLFSVLVLYGLKEKRQKNDIKFKGVKDSVKKHFNIFVAYMATGVESGIYTSIWPLFLFLFFENIIKMGGIISLSIASAAFFAIIVGNIEDKKGEKGLVNIGTPLITASWLIRSFLGNPIVYVFADSLWNFGQKLVVVPLDALSYKKSANGNTAKAILFRELGLNLGALFGFLIMLFVYIATSSYYAIFAVVALISFLPIVSLLTGGFDE